MKYILYNKSTKYGISCQYFIRTNLKNIVKLNKDYFDPKDKIAACCIVKNAYKKNYMIIGQSGIKHKIFEFLDMFNEYEIIQFIVKYPKIQIPKVWIEKSNNIELASKL